MVGGTLTTGGFVVAGGVVVSGDADVDIGSLVTGGVVIFIGWAPVSEVVVAAR
jgi:formylmethanofuran dehydrogenase subunit C